MILIDAIYSLMEDMSFSLRDLIMKRPMAAFLGLKLASKHACPFLRVIQTTLKHKLSE